MIRSVSLLLWPSPLAYREPFFFNATPAAEIYTLSLHDALPIYPMSTATETSFVTFQLRRARVARNVLIMSGSRSEEHTSELQSQSNLVCRLLLEKKNGGALLDGVGRRIDAGGACPSSQRGDART